LRDSTSFLQDRSIIPIGCGRPAAFPPAASRAIREFSSAIEAQKIVFFFPAFSSKEATAPLGILAVATPLIRAGYECRLIDSTITPNFRKLVLEELADALCLAVSLVTGPMIQETVKIAKEVKRIYPDVPVALGGWQPSFLPDQTLAAEYVDVVVTIRFRNQFAFMHSSRNRPLKLLLLTNLYRLLRKYFPR
jgi:hypothetical protein